MVIFALIIAYLLITLVYADQLYKYQLKQDFVINSIGYDIAMIFFLILFIIPFSILVLLGLCKNFLNN
jgi:hypothetical protein